MTLNVLNLIPDQEGYSLTMSTGVIVSQLDGGAPRSRVDILGAWTGMAVQWTVDNDGYEYLQQAFRYCEVNGGAHFLMYLYLSHGVLDQHEVMFVPGTFGLASQKGRQFVVRAQILVKPSTGDDNTWPPPSTYQSILDTDGFLPILT